LIPIKATIEPAAAHGAVALGVVHYDPDCPRRGRPGVGDHSGRAFALSHLSTVSTAT
jgi:hypothetical protein